MKAYSPTMFVSDINSSGSVPLKELVLMSRYDILLNRPICVGSVPDKLLDANVLQEGQSWVTQRI